MTEALYLQIEKTLRHRIENDFYPSSLPLPSEYELAEEFQVSRLTIRKSIKELIDKKILFRRRNAGLYIISQDKISSGANGLLSFTEVAKKHGKIAKTKILSQEEMPYQSEIWESLNIDKQEEVTKLERIRYWDETPMTIEHLYLRKKFLPKTIKAPEWKKSVFKILEKQEEIAYSHQEIEASTATQEIAELLGLQVGDAVLIVHSKTYNPKGEILFLDTSYYRADKYKFSTSYVREVSS